MCKNTKRACQWLSLTIALMLCLSVAALAGPPAANVVPVGENYYVSLHKYATPTDIEDVYKITLTVNGNVKPEPIFITFVLDGSPSMSHIALDDTPSASVESYRNQLGWNTWSPAVDAVSRWEGLVAGFKSAVEIFADPAQNQVYDQTYVSVVTFDSAASSYTKIRTSAAATGLNYAKTSATSVDISTQLPTFSNLYYPISRSFGYKNASNVRSNVTANGGFVNVSEAAEKQKLLECLPEYPYLDQTLATAIPGTWFAFDANGTNTGSGMQLAYELMAGTYVSGMEDARRYIIFLGDGDDNAESYSVTAHQYAAALKAPYFAADGVTPFILGGSSGTLRGMNAEIWGIGLGLSEINSDYATLNQGAYPPLATSSTWSSDIMPWMGSIAGGSGLTSVSPWVGSYIEPHLIALGNVLDDPYDYATYPIGAAAMSNVFSWYNNVGILNNSGNVSGYNIYEYTDHAYPSPSLTGDSALGVFEKYAKRIVGENIKVTDIIGGQFSLYSYPGEPLFKTSGTGAGTAGNAGKTITWNIDQIPIDGSTLQLTYYLKIDSATADPDLWYPTNEEAYIEYDRKGLRALGENPGKTYHTVNYFPVPLVRVDGQVDSEDPPAPSPSPDSAETLSNTINMQPNIVMRYGTPLQPYTPSVTPAPVPTAVVVIEEMLEDGTISRDVDDGQNDWDWGGEEPMPNTGSSPVTAVLLLAVTAITSIALIQVRRSKKRR